MRIRQTRTGRWAAGGRYGEVSGYGSRLAALAAYWRMRRRMRRLRGRSR